jgi:hypothetical protein
VCYRIDRHILSFDSNVAGILVCLANSDFMIREEITNHS